ncbi:MAG: HIT family protein [Thermodesulfovibrionales bacterium]|nr:HIT family protein [Thermodesulfovibrionales bacterium]
MEISRCIFCDIVLGKLPCHLIEESRLSICLLDINPLQEGHCLTIPKRHVPYWHEMTEEETSDLFNLSRKVSLRLMEIYKADLITLYARGRRIPHTHIFLVPTFKNDPVDRHFNALEGFQEEAYRLSFLSTPKELDRVDKLLRYKRD